MTNAVLFSEPYYRDVVAEHGYTTLDLDRFGFALAGLDPATLNARYLCHHQGERFAATPVERRAVTTGFGMSGAPHMATVSHILKMVELQRGGETCQIVLGDLDAYNGKARTFSHVTELATQFREYAVRLGFDPRRGTLRTQVGHLPTLESMYLLARYVDQPDFDAAEEANHSYYASRGLVDDTMTFRRSMSLALMAADFVVLGQEHDAVLVLLGLDEHKYVRFAQEARRRIDLDAPLRADFSLSAVYTRMVNGFGGHPKFSKSIAGSSIDVDTPGIQVRRLLQDEPLVPEASVTYQLMCQLPRYDADRLAVLHGHCLEGGPRWRREVDELADYLTSLIDLWPR